MAKFIIHVGDAKCGSTSIQGSLKQARPSLLAKGLVYETGSSGFNHVDLVRLVRPHARGNLEESLLRGKEIVETLRATLKKGSDGFALGRKPADPAPRRVFAHS